MKIRNLFLILVLLLTSIALLQWGQGHPPTVSEDSQNTSPAAVPLSEILSTTQREEKMAPGISPTPSPTPHVPMTTVSEAEFRALALQTFEKLSRRDDLKTLSSHAVHGTPRVILESGLALGKIAEVISKNPALIDQALQFYSQCALSPELAHTVRALCLARHRHHSGTELPQSSFPDTVIRLSHQVEIQ